MLPAEDQLRNIKNFCKRISKDSIYYISHFYNFFEIPKENRIFDNVSTVSEDESRNTDLHKMSEVSVRGDLLFRASGGGLVKWREFTKDLTINFCLYFHIYVENFAKSANNNFVLFTFRVQSLINPELNYTIDKRYSDFKSIFPKIKKSTKTKIPSLPKKTLIAPKSSKKQELLTKRANSLSEWLLVLTNEKFYQSQILFEFLKIPKNLINTHLSHTPLSSVYNKYSFEVRITETESITTLNSEEAFCLYHLHIKINDKGLRNLVSGYIVKRRFREFDTLHSYLKKMFRKYKKPLPELPPKWFFKGKKDIDTRRYKLEGYLRLLLDYPDIFDCIFFRKFIQLLPEKINEFKVDNGSYTCMVESMLTKGSKDQQM